MAKHLITLIFIACSMRTGVYASRHYHPRHGWTCEATDTGCRLTADTGEQFVMRFQSRLRYLTAGTHVTIHCSR